MTRFKNWLFSFSFYSSNQDFLCVALCSHLILTGSRIESWLTPSVGRGGGGRNGGGKGGGKGGGREGGSEGEGRGEGRGKGGGRKGEGSLNLTTAPYMFPTPTLSLPSPAGSPWKK